MQIAVIVSIIVLIVIAILILLYFLFFRNKKLAKQLQQLERKYVYLHSLLIGQDLGYIKRLEYISRLNLLYVELHQKFLERFEAIHNNRDVYAQKHIDELKDRLIDKKYVQVRSEFQDFKNFIDDFEKDVNKLNSDLIELIRPEENCNHSLLEAKERLRQIRQEYFSNQNDLLILKNSYNEVFKYVEELFTQFEDYVDAANYDDANNLTPKISKILDELTVINMVMPQLCIKANKNTQQKINDLENEYKTMVANKFPVKDILEKKDITNLRHDLDKIILDLKNFKYRGADDQIAIIDNKINDYFNSLNKEKEDANIFKSEIQNVFNHVSRIDTNCMRLRNIIVPKTNHFYVINEKYTRKLNEIKTGVNTLGVSRHLLITSMHVDSQVPFSRLLVKMNTLKEAAINMDKKMDEFQDYLTSLKSDSEEAHNLIGTYYYRLKSVEKGIYDTSLVAFYNKYQDKISEIYQILVDLNVTLNTLPIDVDKVNEIVRNLKTDGDSLVNLTAFDIEMINRAESSIVILGSARGKSTNINALVNQSEGMFFDGDFEKSYHTALGAINEYKNEVSRSS